MGETDWFLGERQPNNMDAAVLGQVDRQEKKKIDTSIKAQLSLRHLNFSSPLI